jgi:hypothetical protein
MSASIVAWYVKYRIVIYVFVLTISGDEACQATKDTLAALKKTFAMQGTERLYGRKIDMMFLDQKRNVSLDTLLYLQTKNLRVPKCILKNQKLE